MAGTKRVGLLGVVNQVIFGALFAAAGGAVTYQWLRGVPDSAPIGPLFSGIGIWMIVRAIRKRRSSESLATVRNVSAHLADVLPAQGLVVDYRTPGRVRKSARELYAPVLATAPLPADRTRAGSVLPFALGVSAVSSTMGFQLIFGIFWTVMSSILVALFSQAGALVIIPVVLLVLGVAILGGGLRKLLSRTKLPIVEVSDEPLYLGDTLRVHIAQRGPAKIERMQVDLLCRERATYTISTSTRTEEADVSSFSLLDDLDGYTLTRSARKTYDLEVVVPPYSPPSFRAKNNSVAWLLRVQAQITGWPDYDELFEIRVLPAPPF